MEKDLIKFYKEQGKSYNITDGGDGAVGILILGLRCIMYTLEEEIQ